MRPQPLGDDALALGGRVDAVGLVESSVAGHTVEQEGCQRGAGRARDGRIDAGERAGVVGAVVRRHAHAGQQHARAGGAGALDDAREIVAQRRHGLTAQAVVGAERDDDDLRMRLERPVDAPQPARARVAAAAGETVAVAGPSGSGKSTLLGLIGGLDAPTSGAIVVAGMEVTRLGEAALARFRRETLGYVFQSYHLIPTLTAAENVAVPFDLAGTAGATARTADLLASVGLGDRGHHYPVQLSGGDQQRVAA